MGASEQESKIDRGPGHKQKEIADQMTTTTFVQRPTPAIRYRADQTVVFEDVRKVPRWVACSIRPLRPMTCGQ